MTQTPKRPRDANQLAKFILDVATGEAVDKQKVLTQHHRAAALGGQKRAETLSDTRKTEIAKKAAETRWAKSALPAGEE